MLWTAVAGFVGGLCGREGQQKRVIGRSLPGPGAPPVIGTLLGEMLSEMRSLLAYRQKRLAIHSK